MATMISIGNRIVNRVMPNFGSSSSGMTSSIIRLAGGLATARLEMKLPWRQDRR